MEVPADIHVAHTSHCERRYLLVKWIVLFEGLEILPIAFSALITIYHCVVSKCAAEEKLDEVSYCEILA